MHDQDRAALEHRDVHNDDTSNGNGRLRAIDALGDGEDVENVIDESAGHSKEKCLAHVPFEDDPSGQRPHRIDGHLCSGMSREAGPGERPKGHLRNDQKNQRWLSNEEDEPVERPSEISVAPAAPTAEVSNLENGKDR